MFQVRPLAFWSLRGREVARGALVGLDCQQAGSRDVRGELSCACREYTPASMGPSLGTALCSTHLLPTNRLSHTHAHPPRPCCSALWRTVAPRWPSSRPPPCRCAQLARVLITADLNVTLHSVIQPAACSQRICVWLAASSLWRRGGKCRWCWARLRRRSRRQVHAAAIGGPAKAAGDQSAQHPARAHHHQ